MYIDFADTLLWLSIFMHLGVTGATDW